MKPTRVLAAAAVALFALATCSTPAVAYDQVLSYNFSNSPTASNQALASAITQLASQTPTSDPQLQSLASQLANALQSGNPAAEEAALSQLESYPNLASEAPALAALLKSTTINGDGTVNLNLGSLGSLIGAGTPGASGVPSALSGIGPQLAAENMQTLLSLVSGLSSANPSLAGGLTNQLLSDLGKMSLSFPDLAAPNLPVGGLKLGNLPGFGTAPLSVPGTSSLVKASPIQTLESLALPAVAAAVGVALFVFRKRLRALFSGQILPGGMGALELDEVTGAATPRNRVLRAFNRMLRAMSQRGVVKQRHETHREFTARCSSLPQVSQVSAVSAHYEKAKFATAEVTEAEAADAEGNAAKVEASVRAAT
ncbi:MAG: DUF4129 domain-containing protein [Nitrososphaerota archaeon]|nr:DUF4129 domain-containing protein [Nitrososphaerota archaeon]